MALRYSHLPELANVWLACKALRWAVVTELKSRMEVGLLTGQGALLMEQSLDRRLKALKRHPISPANVFDYTKSVFKQTPADDGYLLFEDVAMGISPFSLMLNRSSDLDFIQVIFPDHIGNLTSDGENQYSFHCIYRSYDFLESTETEPIFTPKSGATVVRPASDLNHLKLLSIRGIRMDIANNALRTCNGELLRTIGEMHLPRLPEMNLDLCIWSRCWNLDREFRDWWDLCSVRLVLRGEKHIDKPEIPSV